MCDKTPVGRPTTYFDTFHSACGIYTSRMPPTRRRKYTVAGKEFSIVGGQFIIQTA